MLHLPPPAHGLALKNRRMLDGRVAEAMEMRVIRYRFTAELGDLGRFSIRKLVLAVGYLLRQVAEVLFRRPDVGYQSLSTSGGPLLRDAVYMNVFRLLRVPYVLHVPTLGLAGSVRGARGPAGRMIRRGLAGAATVIALNETHRRELAAVAAAERVALLENALPDVAPTEALSGELSGTRPARLLFLSNLREEKGLFTLMEALPRVLERAPDLDVVVAGPWDDDETASRFERLRAEMAAGGRVRHVGPVYDDEKLDLVASSDVFVYPSHRENAPNAVLEAMRAGKPVVSTTVGGVPDMIRHDVDGLLVPPRDAEALADALVDLLQDPARRQAMGRAARRRFEERYTIGRWEDELIGILRSAARAGKASG